MGIDKPDIRLVVHADIPGSLENYLQEAGRAGRDRDHARCILLFSRDDIERQFSLSARSRLEKQRDWGDPERPLDAVWIEANKAKGRGRRHSLERSFARRQDLEFDRDSATDDTSA